MTLVAPHFRLWEAGLSQEKASEYGFDAAPYPDEWVKPRLVPLLSALEELRDGCGGRVMTLVSCYRPREYDLKRIAAGRTGVSPNSQHHLGLAADVSVRGLKAQKVFDVALRLHLTGRTQLGGLGLYVEEDFVHVDVRQLLDPTARFRTWPPGASGGGP